MPDSNLPSGLYEALVTEQLTADFQGLDISRMAVRDVLPAAEAPDRIALHASQVLEHAVARLAADGRTTRGMAILRQLIDELSTRTGQTELALERPTEAGDVLRAVVGYRLDGSLAVPDAPLTPLLDTTLLTNAPGEPRMGRQLVSELASADRVDIVMAFVRWSGIAPLMEALRRVIGANKTVRLLTTTYTGSTEARALDELHKTGVQVRVSYDLSSTRLHAKAWLFHRASGYSTAFVGSSNLTHSAQVTGLEWNLRISGKRNPGVIRQVEAIFETYWNNPDFVLYDAEDFLACSAKAIGNVDSVRLPPADLRAEPFQARLLERLALARQHGHHRNLLVAATGTGKTVMAALDYVALRKQLPRARLLFVAHRQEILCRSRATYCQALRDSSFGEEWVAGRRPRDFEHVFASIQSLAHTDLAHLPPDHFDVVVIDEFHHAAAESYRRWLEHLQPRELLGLTATPERSDGLDVLSYFEGRIAAELRLWDAIDQQRLTPFAYYGLHDGTDLRQVAWRRGKGYDVAELTNVLTRGDFVAHRVLKELALYVANPLAMKALGFCVSVEHARFMANAFQKAGIGAVAVWAETPSAEREAALRNLAEGRVQIVFTVDLFNEGIDIPAVDTLLMLRPTESATLFIQQLGRGLRRNPDKALCTVLDFVGQHRAEFRFDLRLRALVPGTRKQLEKQVEAGFPLLPAGCHMSLDRKSSEIVLESIRRAIPGTWPKKVAALKSALAGGMPAKLTAFLDGEGLDLDDIYGNVHCWSELLHDAGVAIAAVGPHEKPLRAAVGRLLHLDDAERISKWRAWAGGTAPPQVSALPERQRRLARMLAISLLSQVDTESLDLQSGLALIWLHPQVLVELEQLLAVLANRVEHVTAPLENRPDVPLQVHAQYTRLEILSAMDEGADLKLPEWREGVRWNAGAKADIFTVTIDKTSGRFSPSTRYRDYAISQELFHWESQSTTRAQSITGRRYQRHATEGSSVLIFVRKTDDDRAFYFIGEAVYQRHESEAPMAITWQLREPLPGDLYAEFSAA